MGQHRVTWSYERGREVCSCGGDLPCPAAALAAPTQQLHSLIGDRAGVAPLLSSAWRRLLAMRS
ncbi:hypothetical protein QTQ03_28620 [Micromonospora sp. WMMA1363]|uniref:hypothetical protein n=1 Tax=Micromonospora sp. WMMA1363 TaxID=3053985 RepID=UPI00259CFB78|nr:hypothetical protein [Micromonospora sp. WMMA1363]MDM4723278.1 hypothetical protein [Micromonospora sp. WMMA1363]MDM4723372.1 hypothetical protein [Micromonospora sp. WMMA1363]